jgi:L-2-hydroxyglutarate oxidase
VEEKKYNIAIIGGGILGISIGYFLAFNSKANTIIIEQEKDVGYHTSSRNTGKVHSPFLYDPQKKKIFGKIAYLGYEMWEKYSHSKNIYFKNDGVIEIAKEDKDIDTLRRYLEWGIKNGLDEKDISFLDFNQTRKIEPNVKCRASIYCKRDASVDYSLLTKYLKEDYLFSGGNILFSHKVKRIKSGGQNTIIIRSDKGKEETIQTDYIINAAGGNSLEIAHSFGIGKDFINLYFRGEYWISPKEYESLTCRSIYTVPRQKKFPFLDPHWIVRIDGHCEVGPNALPVCGAYAYNIRKNFREVFPRIQEVVRKKGFWSLVMDKEFLSLILTETNSSISKKAMINRVKQFLPLIDPKKFNRRGISGIRSVLINNQGSFIPDTLLLKDVSSLHILNYNSPGATGALPMAAMIVHDLAKEGIILKNKTNEIRQTKTLQGIPEPVWNIEDIYSRIRC